MATRAGEHIFVDTNVLIYATAFNSPLHTISRDRLNGYWEIGAVLWINRQVLREYIATLTRPQTFVRPQPASVIIADVQQFEKQFRIAEEDWTVTARLAELVDRFAIGGKQIHDANIVATMLTHNIPALLTHNVADFERFASLITILPLEDI